MPSYYPREYGPVHADAIKQYKPVWYNTTRHGLAEPSRLRPARPLRLSSGYVSPFLAHLSKTNILIPSTCLSLGPANTSTNNTRQRLLTNTVE